MLQQGADGVSVEPTNSNVFSPLSARNGSVSVESAVIELRSTGPSKSVSSVGGEVKKLDSVSETSLVTVTESSDAGDVDDSYNEWLDPYSPKNRGIFSSYFAVGFVLYFLLTPLLYYLVDDLGATPGQQSVIIGLMELPWALKIMFGFITDSFPIFGLRRKPHYVIGWGIYVLSNLALAVIGRPGIEMVALFVFIQTMGFIQADVCMDAMIVERSKAHETIRSRGTLQAFGYILRFAGSIMGAVCGAVLYNKSSWGWGLPISAIFAVNAIVPMICVAPFLYTLAEVTNITPPNIKTQMESMWVLVQRRAIWQPCTFIYVYNALYLTNPAWRSFLVVALDFSNFDLGMLTLAGTILSYLGIVIYKKFMFDSSWRYVYMITTAMSALFSLFQLILVLKLHEKMGMGGKGGEMFFAIGSYGVVQLVQAIQFLPAVRMFLAMCPIGAEGASYAMLTTLSNVGSTTAYSIAAGFATVWDVHNSTLEDGDMNGMWKLTVFCAGIQLVPLALLGLLPRDMKEQHAMQESSESSVIMGAVFVGVIVASLLFVFIFSIITIIS